MAVVQVFAPHAGNNKEVVITLEIDSSCVHRLLNKQLCFKLDVKTGPQTLLQKEKVFTELF